MTSDVRAYMDTVAMRVAQDSFGKRAAPTVALSPDTAERPGEGIFGTLEVRIRTRDGSEPVIHREPFARVQTRQDVDDFFARALSVVLMNHADWPR